MKKHSSFLEQRESGKEVQSVRRDSRDVMSELVAQLRKQVDRESVAVRGEDKDVPDGESPNLDRLTVGVDLGDQWSHYCILGRGGETLTEGQLRTRRQEVSEFFQGLARSRVVIEVGTHSAWVGEVIAGLGHEVLVATARRMAGCKRRRRKNDRMDHSFLSFRFRHNFLPAVIADLLDGKLGSDSAR